ncbi:MAG: glycosyltransferase family 1 protein [Planctomycetota bacterium]
MGAQGVGRYVRELVRALVERGDVEPRLFAPTRSGAPPAQRAELGLGRAGRARLFAPRLPSKALTAVLGAAGVGTERLLGGADVAHHTQYRRLPTRLPEVATLHDLVFLDSDRYVGGATAQRMSAFARDAARRCSALITPTQAVANEVATRLDVPRERIVATPLGVDHVHRMPRDADEIASARRDRAARGPFVLTAARVERRKNLVTVLRALERLGSDAPRWVVAGVDGEGAEEFDDALRRSPVASLVTRLGHVPEARLRALLEVSSAFVLVPFDEGFGLGPLEAMALGVPAITSDVPVVREVCTGGAALVDPRDDAALADEIAALVQDEDRAAEAGRAGRAHAAPYRWARTAESTVAAYRLAVESGPTRLPRR